MFSNKKLKMNIEKSENTDVYTIRPIVLCQLLRHSQFEMCRNWKFLMNECLLKKNILNTCHSNKSIEKRNIKRN